MRELTPAEQAIMNEAIRPFWIERDGLLPKEQRAFKRGFTAGLDHAAGEVERLRAALEQIAAGHPGYSTQAELWLSASGMADIARQALEGER